MASYSEMTKKRMTTLHYRGDSPGNDRLFVDWQILCVQIISGPVHKSNAIIKSKTLSHQLHINDA